jgi:hypothetical protein
MWKSGGHGSKIGLRARRYLVGNVELDERVWMIDVDQGVVQVHHLLIVGSCYAAPWRSPLAVPSLPGVPIRRARMLGHERNVPGLRSPRSFTGILAGGVLSLSSPTFNHSVGFRGGPPGYLGTTIAALTEA